MSKAFLHEYDPGTGVNRFYRSLIINIGTLGEKRMERSVIDGHRETILARLDHFCGIYGALSSGRLASDRQ